MVYLWTEGLAHGTAPFKLDSTHGVETHAVFLLSFLSYAPDKQIDKQTDGMNILPTPTEPVLAAE